MLFQAVSKVFDDEDTMHEDATTEMNDIPLTPFTGWLKCHRPVDLSDFGKDALQFALPRFLERTEPDAHQRAQMSTAGQLYDYVHAPLRNRRRFAGDYLDYTLPRGSYYTLCLDRNGDDKQTLAFEMTAYSDPERTGEVSVFDLSDKRIADQVTGNQRTQHAVGLLFRSRSEKRNPFLPIASRHLNRSADELAEQDVLVLLPYRVIEATISRTIDLRLPVTRDWFWRAFRSGDGKVLKVLDGSATKSFFHMLPTLMWPELGGHDVGQAIGLWMRLNHVEALIYPSARNDTRCVVKGGALDHAFGWNLVDYRESPPVDECIVKTVIAGFWEQRVVDGFRVATAPIGDAYEGSFNVDGVLAALLAKQTEGVEKFYAAS